MANKGRKDHVRIEDDGTEGDFFFFFLVEHIREAKDSLGHVSNVVL